MHGHCGGGGPSWAAGAAGPPPRAGVPRRSGAAGGASGGHPGRRPGGRAGPAGGVGGGGAWRGGPRGGGGGGGGGRGGGPQLPPGAADLGLLRRFRAPPPPRLLDARALIEATFEWLIALAERDDDEGEPDAAAS